MKTLYYISLALLVTVLTLTACINIQLVECDATPEGCTTEAVSIDTVTDIQPKNEDLK